MTVIFINGCTSAGKSGLARALQVSLPGLWLATGIDHAIATAPPRLHHNPDGFWFDHDEEGLVRLSFGADGLALLAAHRRAVAAMCADGTGVILDEVLVFPGMLDSWLDALIGHEVWMVGIFCDLPELERREVARGDRRIGQARGQFAKVHIGVQYDIELDSTTRSAETLAQQVIESIADLAQPRAFDAMRQSR